MFRNSVVVTTKEIRVIVGYLTGKVLSNTDGLNVIKRLGGKFDSRNNHYELNSEVFHKYLKGMYKTQLTNFKLHEGSFDDIYYKASNWAINHDISL